jgi:hypothetical protein
MATMALCGQSGSVGSITGGLEVTEWNLDLVVDSIEATSMGAAGSNGWHEKIPCLKGGSGNFITIGSMSAVGSTAATFTDASVGGTTISGTIIITDIQISTPVAEKVAWDHKFVFTGTITAAGLI